MKPYYHNNYFIVNEKSSNLLELCGESGLLYVISMLSGTVGFMYIELHLTAYSFLKNNMKYVAHDHIFCMASHNCTERLNM